VSKDTDRILGHADESDGIEEYDNPLPDWWVGLFWLTIVWSVGYALWFHAFSDRSPEARLAQEMAAAEARFASQPGAGDGVAATFAVTPEAVAAGGPLYATYCVACHGAEMEGGIGPSLVDVEWIHGGQASDVIRVITEGVPAKGMIPWKGILSPEQINQVAAYVVSKHSEATGRTLEEILAAPGDAGPGGEEEAEGAGEAEAGSKPPPPGPEGAGS
jgi:cytochrome c oxidase cbb3-type subunit 3